MIGDITFLVDDAEVQSTVSIISLHEMIVQGKFSPENLVKSGDEEQYHPLYTRTDLIPFQRMREEIFRAYDSFDLSASMFHCNQLLDYDRMKSSAERVDALLVKGLLLQKKDPGQAERCYLECLHHTNADITPIVYNNLGVMCMRFADVKNAIINFDTALTAKKSFLPALMNLSYLYDELKSCRNRDLTYTVDNITYTEEKVAKILEGKNTFSIDDFDELLDQKPFPGTNEALILYCDDIPQSFGCPHENQNKHALGRQCFDMAIEAFAKSRFEDAKLMFHRAQTYNPNLEKKAEEYIVRAQREIELRDAWASNTSMASILQRIVEMENQNRFEEAIELLLEVKSRFDDNEQNELIESIIRRLNQKAGQYYYEKGCMLEEEGKCEEAMDWYQMSHRFDPEKKSAVHLHRINLTARSLWRAFNETIGKNDFAEAFKIAGNMKNLSDNEWIVGYAHMMMTEVKEKLKEAGLEALYQVGNKEALKKVKEMLIRCSPEWEPVYTLKNTLSLIELFEKNGTFRYPIIFLIQGNYENALMAIRKIDFNDANAEDFKNYYELLFREIRNDKNQLPVFITQRFEKARHAIEHKHWEDAKREMLDVRQVDPVNSGVLEVLDDVEHGEMIEKASALISCGKIDEAEKTFDEIYGRWPRDAKAQEGRLFCRLHGKVPTAEHVRLFEVVREMKRLSGEHEDDAILAMCNAELANYPEFIDWANIADMVILIVINKINSLATDSGDDPDGIERELNTMKNVVERCWDRLDDDIRNRYEMVVEQLEQRRRNRSQGNEESVTGGGARDSVPDKVAALFARLFFALKKLVKRKK